LRRKLRVNESARERDQSAERPGGKNQNCGRHLLRDHVRINENPRADDAAHDDHRGIEQTEAAHQVCFRRRDRGHYFSGAVFF
jgi:hypothetical protein